MQAMISSSKRQRNAALVIGLIVITASSIPALLTPADAAAQLQVNSKGHGHVIASIKPATRRALEEAFGALQQGDFDQARALLGRAKKGFRPTGERSDYFLLHAAELKTYAFERQMDVFNAGYLQWMLESPTEGIANDFLAVALAVQQYDAIRAAADQMSSAVGSGAAARLAVGVIEAEVAQGNGVVLADPAWLGEAAGVVGGHQLSEQIFLSLWSTAPIGAGNPTQAQVAGAIATAYGVDRLDAGFLLNWAFLELAEENHDASLEILERAKPLIMTNAQDARWNWAYASVMAAQGFLPEALFHAGIVEDLVNDHEINVGVNLAHQVHILRAEVRRKAAHTGEILDPEQNNLLQLDREVEIDPCDVEVTPVDREVVTEILEP